MLERLCAQRVTGVFASHLHMLHSLLLDAPGLARLRMEVVNAQWQGAGDYPLKRERARGLLQGSRLHGLCVIFTHTAAQELQGPHHTIVHPHAGFGRSPKRPTWRVQEGVCTDSLALEVALACGAPVPVMRRAAALAQCIAPGVAART